MTTTPTTIGHEAPRSPRHRPAHTAIAVASIAALIAAGGYTATKTIGPDAYKAKPAPATSQNVVPSERTQQELRRSIEGQYGTSPSTDVRASRQAQNALRDVAIDLYGPH